MKIVVKKYKAITYARWTKQVFASFCCVKVAFKTLYTRRYYCKEKCCSGLTFSNGASALKKTKSRA